MDNYSSPRSVTGQVSWNGNDAAAEEQPSSSQDVQRGPLTGKPVAEQQEAQDKPASRARSSSRRDRKSESAFRTISEVADILDVQQHVLRFWETKFSQVRPLKRGGGRRYYRPEDLALLQKIHHLLYTEGYTIKGVQKLLKEQGKKALLEETPKPQAANAEIAAAPPVAAPQVSKLESVLNDLKDMRKLLSSE